MRLKPVTLRPKPRGTPRRTRRRRRRDPDTQLRLEVFSSARSPRRTRRSRRAAQSMLKRRTPLWRRMLSQTLSMTLRCWVVSLPLTGGIGDRGSGEGRASKGARESRSAKRAWPDWPEQGLEAARAASPQRQGRTETQRGRGLATGGGFS